LTDRFSRAINIKDDPRIPSAIREPTRVPVGREWATHEIIEKERAQSVNRCLSECCQKTRERRTGRQPIPLKQGHEGDSKGLKPLVEGFQGAFPADGVPEKDREKFDRLLYSDTLCNDYYMSR
jgi:hypothetical protein